MERHRLPPWLRTQLPAASHMAEIRKLTYAHGLHTVCREARCPNQGECSARGEATFLILGETCTRDCSFCAVRQGKPGEVDRDEARRVAASVNCLRLTHAVVTSVTRDDLPDGGASVFAETIGAIRLAAAATTVEVLIPDFLGSLTALEMVVAARPEVINHNVETVPRLYPVVRRGADYTRSLKLLRRVTQLDRGIITKSGVMVGMGETMGEIIRVVQDLVDAGCQAFTVGQYLRPTPRNYPVQRFVSPEEFDEIKSMALALGMTEVAAGPLVRSSYRAGEVFRTLRASRQKTVLD